MGGPGLQTIEQGIAALEARFEDFFGDAPDEQSLRAAQAKIVGKKGELTAILGYMRSLSDEERPLAGQRVNAFKERVEAEFSRRLEALRTKAREAELAGFPWDVTLPGRIEPGVGHPHPIRLVQEELLEIFQGLGFSVVEGPEVELEENNFTKLAFPPDHPATDMQDTFWVGPQMLLRTHTSNVQVREMSKRKPPMAIVSPGAVYRRDDDVTHSPMFHQIEAFTVGESISMAHLKGVVSHFAQRLYGPKTPVRFRPSYFPFVEPGMEVDVGCAMCVDESGARKGCRVCKHTGWMEILGCGMIHPEVFRHCGIDPEQFSGFALGLGVERVAMLRYGIPDIRLLFENDPRFLSQFSV